MAELSKYRNGIWKIVGAITALGTLGGGLLFVDGRYVHADSYSEDQKGITEEIRQVVRTRIEDEIFKLQLIPPEKRSTVDNAVLERYQNRLRELDNKNVEPNR